jgi:hypothetical protein
VTIRHELQKHVLCQTANAELFANTTGVNDLAIQVVKSRLNGVHSKWTRCPYIDSKTQGTSHESALEDGEVVC